MKAVIFDMDGVMTDSEHMINEAAMAGLREFGIESTGLRNLLRLAFGQFFP